MRKIDKAFSDSLKSPRNVIPIQDVLLVRIEPLARYRPHAILAIRDDAYLGLRASSPLSCYRLNVLRGTAILVPDDREHFALLSVGLDQPRDDLQTGLVRRAPTFDESSIYANDHPLGRFIRFSILRNFPLYLFVDALPNGVDPVSGSGMGSSAHRWEEHSQQRRSLAIRNLRSQAHLQLTQLGRHSPREDFRNRAPNPCAGAALTTSISRNPEASRPYDGMAGFSEEHKQRAAQLLVTAANLERGYQAFRGSGNLQVFQPQVNELGRLHRQWLSDLDGFKNSLRAQGAEPKTLEYVNEAFSRLTERIKRLAG
jgi:hypothetical protein